MYLLSYRLRYQTVRFFKGRLATAKKNDLMTNSDTVYIPDELFDSAYRFWKHFSDPTLQDIQEFAKIMYARGKTDGIAWAKKELSKP